MERKAELGKHPPSFACDKTIPPSKGNSGGCKSHCECKRSNPSLSFSDLIGHEGNLKRYFSRVRTPKDNPEAERFNQTLEYEWLYDCNLTTNCDEFNHSVTDWLIEYNFNRPHQAFDYLTPMGYIENYNENLK